MEHVLIAVNGVASLPLTANLHSLHTLTSPNLPCVCRWCSPTSLCVCRWCSPTSLCVCRWCSPTSLCVCAGGVVRPPCVCAGGVVRPPCVCTLEAVLHLHRNSTFMRDPAPLPASMSPLPCYSMHSSVNGHLYLRAQSTST